MPPTRFDHWWAPFVPENLATTMSLAPLATSVVPPKDDDPEKRPVATTFPSGPTARPSRRSSDVPPMRLAHRRPPDDEDFATNQSVPPAPVRLVPPQSTLPWN